MGKLGKTSVSLGLGFALFGLQAMAVETPVASTMDLKPYGVEFLSIANPGGLKIRGKLNADDATTLDGKLVLTGLNVTGSTKIKMEKFDTGIDLRNKHMKEKYLQVKEYPVSTITITKLTLPDSFKGEAAKAEKIPVEGKLEFHGVTKDVKGLAFAEKSASGLGMDLEFKLLITEFGMTQPSFLGITVANEVMVTGQVRGVKKTL